MVIYAFVGVCALSVLFVIFNPSTSFSRQNVIDESAILVHNGNSESMFKQGANKMFEEWTVEDVNDIMQNYIADNPNIPPCRSKDDTEVVLPSDFDWREQFPECV